MQGLKYIAKGKTFKGVPVQNMLGALGQYARMIGKQPDFKAQSIMTLYYNYSVWASTGNNGQSLN